MLIATKIIGGWFVLSVIVSLFLGKFIARGSR